VISAVAAGKENDSQAIDFIDFTDDRSTEPAVVRPHRVERCAEREE
jgi:hypothetical protein